MASVHTTTEAKSRLLASGATKTEAKKGIEFFFKKKKKLIWPRVAQKTEAKRLALWSRVCLNINLCE